MHRSTAGFLGGVIAGFIKLLIDQLAIAINLSYSSVTDVISQILFIQGGVYFFISWIIYILFSDLMGFIISKIITKILVNFLYWGTIAGITIWALTSGIFALLGKVDPTWSMGLSTGLVNFFSDIVLGIVITYTISLSIPEETY
jgi:hypothetical protein